jgi:predicted RND superfamily exporter protein
VDPEITGPPVQVLEMTELMRVSLLRAAGIALAAIVLLVAISMRSILGSALALLPLLVGFALMLGVLSWLDIPLNPANLVALPLLLGIGVDGGMHLAHRWMDLRDSATLLKDVGHALLITSLTTVAGFLPLLLARHQGIRSLGVVTCIGSLAMLLSAVILVPALLALFDDPAKRAARRASRPAASP